jgi:vacuolar-type H+-ATPase subunit I/STV1
MNTRPLALLGLVVAGSAVLGSLTSNYALVQLSARIGSRAPVILSTLLGAAGASFAAALSLRALRRSGVQSERFFALLGLVLSAFCLFVILVGYGLPQAFLRPGD